MARPNRVPDEDLTTELEKLLRQSGRSKNMLAADVGVSASTLTRSMKRRAFSRELAAKLRAEVNTGKEAEDGTLHKVLRLLRQSDMLRVRAERLLADHLDRSASAE